MIPMPIIHFTEFKSVLGYQLVSWAQAICLLCLSHAGKTIFV